MENWYQNEVDVEVKRVGSRDKVKHNERSDQLFLERMMHYIGCKACHAAWNHKKKTI